MEKIWKEMLKGSERKRSKYLESYAQPKEISPDIYLE